MISGYSWMPFPLLRYVLFFILGIIISENYQNISYFELAVSALIAISFSIPFFFLNRQLAQLSNGISILCIWILFGIFVQKYSASIPINNQDLNTISEADGFSGILLSGPKSTPKTNRYLMKMEHLKKGDSLIPFETGIILYLKKSDQMRYYEYGDRIFVKAKAVQISGPKNPDDFDYADFMKRKGFQFQSYSKSGDVYLLDKNNGNCILTRALESRTFLQSVLEKNINNENNLRVAEALILGHKDDMPDNVRTAFTDSGAIHVLAVSGLHVGLIYGILIFILSFLKRWKYGSIGIFFIAVLVLFLYALITGFSPSVSRAVIMFSTLALSKLINRKSSIYNNLALAGIIILIIEPMMIYDLGFQLSFLAVFSIVFFYPFLTEGIAINNFLLDKMYKLTAVSLAAQIGTFPISLYYFHQFPNYFILSNFIVIPFAAIILGLGIALLSFHFLPFLEKILAWMLEMSITILNKSVFFIQNLPLSVSKDIYFDHWHMLFSLMVISIMIMIMVFRKKRFFYALLVVFCLMSGYQWILNYNFSGQAELVLFSEKSQDFVAIVDGKTIYSNFNYKKREQSNFWKYSLSSYKRKRGADNLKVIGNEFYRDERDYSIWLFNDQILIKPKREFNLTMPADYILIDSFNAKMVLQSEFNPPKGFILGNNIPYFIRSKIIKELTNRKSDFHDLKSDGALVLK